jgi:hypothetical protein
MRALQRQWLLLSQVPRAPRGIDTATLEVQLREAGFPIHRRTIQRDLVALSRMFPLVCDETTKPFAWSWSRDAAALTIPAMGPHTALIFKIAADVLAPILPPETQAFVTAHLPVAEGVLAMSGTVMSTWPERLRDVPLSTRDGRVRIELQLQGANQVVPTSICDVPANGRTFAAR